MEDFEVLAGCEINDSIKEAIEIAAKERRSVKFEFNGVHVTVEDRSDPSLIYRDWLRALNDYIPKDVGPFPAELTAEETASDDRIKAQHDAERKIQEEGFAERERLKREAVEARLSGAESIQLSDPARWQESKDLNSDGYGGAVVSYAERWARLMQVEMDNGATLESVADQASHDTDLEGITGFMYGCAVATLSKCWIHGDALRRWHNIKTQLGNEGETANETGGVLNPALMSIRGGK